MQCKSCGSDLVRGFTFCLNCGMPVPTEMLTESGLPPRNIDSGPQDSEEAASPPSPAEQGLPEEAGELKPHLQGEDRDVGGELKPQLQGGDSSVNGKDLKPQLMGLGDEESGKALKPKYIGGEEQAAGGQGVRAAMQDSSSSGNDSTIEKLVFCPNCGMRMQHDSNKCEACGMPLGNKPDNVPAASGGIPLFNTDADPFSGAGGFGGVGGLSDEDASRIDNFINGNSDPMFYNGDATFNVRATPNDFAELTEQLANFSAAAGIQTLDVTENTTIRQKEPEKGQEREVSDFSMSGDLSSEPIPISDNGIPVIGDCSMDEDPNSNLIIDPYAFLSTSMDEVVPDLTASEPQPETFASIPDTVSNKPGIEPISAPTAEKTSAEPLRPQPFGETEENYEEAPFIAEETPFISEQTAPVSAPKPAVNEQIPPLNDQALSAGNTVPAVSAPKPQQIDNSTAVTAPTRNFSERSEKQAVQPDKGSETVKASPTADTPAAPARPKPAESTKKCYACGRIMPASDKFCPNCGRSTFGVPNPNLMSHTPSPAPVKKKPTALIVMLIILLMAAAVAVTIFIMKKSSAEVYSDELAQTAANNGQTLSESISSEVTEHFAPQLT